MKTIDDFKDDVKDEPHAYMTALIEFVDADQSEGMIKALCQAYESGNDESLVVFAKSLAQSIEDAIRSQAKIKHERHTMVNSVMRNMFDDVFEGMSKLSIRGQNL